MAQAYVKQQDIFYSQLTVRETLLMAARLRLPRGMSIEEKTEKVDELINHLGLAKVYTMWIGGVKGRRNLSSPFACNVLVKSGRSCISSTWGIHPTLDHLTGPHSGISLCE